MVFRPSRVQLHLTPNTEILRYDYQSLLLNRINNWLGVENIEPDHEVVENLSLYSFSLLRGRYETSPEGISFPEGSTLRFSTAEGEVMQTLLENVGYDTNLFGGVQVFDIQNDPVKNFQATERFFLSSPALVRDPDRPGRHLLYTDPRTTVIMSEVMQRKLEKANIDGRVSVYFDTNYRQAKYKTAIIGDKKYVCSHCPVYIEASSVPVVEFAWAVGVGDCASAGFGAIL